MSETRTPTESREEIKAKLLARRQAKKEKEKELKGGLNPLPGEGKPAKKKKKPTAAVESPAGDSTPTTAEKPPTRKEKVVPAKDHLGARLGSNAAKLHSALTAEPTHYKALWQNAGLPKDPFLRDHLRKLVADGKLVEPEKLWFALKTTDGE